jgi:hypothetical protein
LFNLLFFRHQKREAEPKDNDINKLPIRNMHISTYKQIATDGEVLTQHLIIDFFLRTILNYIDNSTELNNKRSTGTTIS